ncbi:arginyl-tRNA synthetase, putative [Eimeria maxima]|uniref:arginine--tRNA ligase n=1 Tax=Eimeria maxima TaxID=5804 RepID=U6LZ62_EIMMA|nr:arginyl-tRNA synthetase, putative [Eimeria maxima]CDJ57252.1 arginyl-tRNA synthetase, putative [Eimeria maxima]
MKALPQKGAAAAAAASAAASATAAAGAAVAAAAAITTAAAIFVGQGPHKISSLTFISPAREIQSPLYIHQGLRLQHQQQQQQQQQQLVQRERRQFPLPHPMRVEGPPARCSSSMLLPLNSCSSNSSSSSSTWRSSASSINSSSSNSSSNSSTLQDVCLLIEEEVRTHARKAGICCEDLKIRVTPASPAVEGYELQANIAALLKQQQQQQRQRRQQQEKQQQQPENSIQLPSEATISEARASRTAAAAAAAAADEGLRDGAEFVASLMKESSLLKEICSAAEYTGKGFISFRLRDDLLLQLLQQQTQDPDRLGLPPVLGLDRMQLLIDYFSPNVGKDLHVGHLRGALVGDSLARLLEFIGLRVHRSCYFGDCGIPSAVCLGGLQVYKKMKQLSSSSSGSSSSSNGGDGGQMSPVELLLAAADAVVADTPPEYRPVLRPREGAAAGAAGVAAAGAAGAAGAAAPDNHISDADVEAFMSHMAALEAALEEQQQQQKQQEEKQQQQGGKSEAAANNIIDWQQLAKRKEPQTKLNLTEAYARFARQLRLLRLSPQAADGEQQQLQHMQQLIDVLKEKDMLLPSETSSSSSTISSSSSSSSNTSPLNVRFPQTKEEIPHEQQQHQQQQQQQQLDSVAIRRQGGTYTYIATDLAALKSRVERGNDWVLLVTDEQQASHFKRLFAIGKNILKDKTLIEVNARKNPLMQHLQQQQQQQQQQRQVRPAVYVQHIGVGLVKGPTGEKLSSRTAANSLTDRIEEMLQVAEAELRRRQPNLSEAEIRQRAEGIKYLTQQHSELGTPMGAPKEPLKRAPYALSTAERRLAAKAASFGVYVHRSAACLDPSLLVSFLLDLANSFNSFYEAYHVICSSSSSSSSSSNGSRNCSRRVAAPTSEGQQPRQQQQEQTQQQQQQQQQQQANSRVYVHPQRLLICQSVKQTLEKGLQLLGADKLADI